MFEYKVMPVSAETLRVFPVASEYSRFKKRQHNAVRTNDKKPSNGAEDTAAKLLPRRLDISV